MTVFIESAQLNEMNSCENLANNDKEKQAVKLVLLQSVKEVYGDMWNRLQTGTKKAIDFMCWFSSEKGYVFASQEYIANRYGISDRTIRRVIEKLHKNGVIEIAYRRNPNGNSKGKPMYFFTTHEYYMSDWHKLFTDDQEHVQKENSEKPVVTRDQGSKKVSTNLLPKSIINNHLNVFTSFIKYVPKSLQRFKKIFGESLRVLWQRVHRAYKKFVKSHNVNLSKEERESIGLISIQSLITYIKKGQAQSLEEQCRLVFAIASNQFEQLMSHSKAQEMTPEKADTFEAAKENERKNRKKKASKRDKLPKWVTDEEKNDPAEDSQSLQQDKERFDQLMEQLRMRKLAAEKG
ncbi:helix-turn-helix domain-containing protein [Desertibacillus haloalkaliphilus]|uniref:helix-turn-helix domain-containing protein n=1 Tax=Desertibacillus haloalkaliphilus TaxID=1328930 RepID=UPI001C25E360|nr:helix-turn-helix domain-containing protein [Desertibacillus haloalkaliphilus]MBU8908201.1 helix-turn-helix domain-containing protein [Desertibacillus haloalkaliphilus]